MVKKLEFDMVEATDPDNFREAVNQKLTDGWKLYGSMIAFYDFSGNDGTTGVRYLQAFTRKIVPPGVKNKT